MKLSIRKFISIYLWIIFIINFRKMLSVSSSLSWYRELKMEVVYDWRIIKQDVRQVAAQVGAQLVGQEVASNAVWQLHETGHKCAIGPELAKKNQGVNFNLSNYIICSFQILYIYRYNYIHIESYIYIHIYIYVCISLFQTVASNHKIEWHGAKSISHLPWGSNLQQVQEAESAAGGLGRTTFRCMLCACGIYKLRFKALPIENISGDGDGAEKATCSMDANKPQR